MYMSNIIQPDSGKKTLQPTDAHLSPYRITPCAKAIGALLLVLGSTAAWADSKDSLFDEVGAVFTEASDLFQAIKPVAAKVLSPEPIAQKQQQLQERKNPKAGINIPRANIVDNIAKSTLVIGHNLQAGSYLANQMAAQQMFIIGDVQHRQGETPYTDPMTGEQKVTSMWLNTNGAITRFNSAQGQLHTKGTRYATQLGGEISQWHIGEHDLGILGITAGIGKANSRSNSTTSQHHANGSVVGYNLGLYSVWHANNISQLGPYIGLLAQYGMFNNQIKASEVVTGANYKSYIFTSALETGYKIQLIEKDKATLFVQPQAKVLLQRSSGLQHKELTGPQIKIEEHNTVTTKLGLLTALELGTDTLSTTNTLKIKPFIEANWINRNGNKGLLLDNAHIAPQGINNIAELKLGVEGKFNNNLKLWSHLGQQLGKYNYSDIQATLGINYQF